MFDASDAASPNDVASITEAADASPVTDAGTTADATDGIGTAAAPTTDGARTTGAADAAEASRQQDFVGPLLEYGLDVNPWDPVMIQRSNLPRQLIGSNDCAMILIESTIFDAVGRPFTSRSTSPDQRLRLAIAMAEKNPTFVIPDTPLPANTSRLVQDL